MAPTSGMQLWIHNLFKLLANHFSGLQAGNIIGSLSKASLAQHFILVRVGS